MPQITSTLDEWYKKMEYNGKEVLHLTATPT